MTGHPRSRARSRRMRALARLLVPMIALVLGGCAEERSGDATAGDGPDQQMPPTLSTPDVPETSEPTRRGESGGPSTAELQPCHLLTADEQAQFDLGAGIEDEVGPARVCLWQATGQHSLSVGVIDELGLDEVQSTGALEPTTVGSHDAVRYDGPLGTCTFAIAVTDTSRVDVSGVAGGDMTTACAVAKQAADLVETKLSR